MSLRVGTVGLVESLGMENGGVYYNRIDSGIQENEGSSPHDLIRRRAIPMESSRQG